MHIYVYIYIYIYTHIYIFSHVCVCVYVHVHKTGGSPGLPCLFSGKWLHFAGTGFLRVYLLMPPACACVECVSACVEESVHT